MQRFFARNKGPVFYTSVTNLPVWNWHKMQKTGDLRYLLRGHDEDYPEVEFEVANDIRCVIEDEFKQRWPAKGGLAILQLHRKKANYQLKYMQTGDKHLQTLIETINIQIAQGKPDSERINYAEIEAWVASESGAPAMDMRKITVERFYTLCDQISKRYATSTANAASRA